MSTYQGWTNYETWCVALWLDNEEGSYNYCVELATNNRSAYELGEVLKEMHQEAAPEVTGVFADLQNAALSAVNWRELAEHYLAVVEDNERLEA